MRYSILSIAALGFASIALAAPASFQKRDYKGKVKVVTETATVTVTEIVYVPDSSSTPLLPPVTTPEIVHPTTESKRGKPTPTPETTPEPTPTPTPTPKPAPETPTPYVPVPTPQKPDVISQPVPTSSKSIPKPTSTQPSEPTNTPPGGTNPSDLSDFEREFLDIHNNLRAKTGAPPLKVSREMCSYAQNHVASCIFQHSSPHKYGENLGAGYESVTATVQAWFDEWKKYPFDKPDFYPGTGHFTQVVWKSATQVGCAQHTCNGANGTPGVYYSCNYDAGNLIGSFGDNVSAPTS